MRFCSPIGAQNEALPPESYSPIIRAARKEARFDRTPCDIIHSASVPGDHLNKPPAVTMPEVDL